MFKIDTKFYLIGEVVTPSNGKIVTYARQQTTSVMLCDIFIDKDGKEFAEEMSELPLTVIFDKENKPYLETLTSAQFAKHMQKMYGINTPSSIEEDMDLEPVNEMPESDINETINSEMEKVGVKHVEDKPVHKSQIDKFNERYSRQPQQQPKIIKSEPKIEETKSSKVVIKPTTPRPIINQPVQNNNSTVIHDNTSEKRIPPIPVIKPLEGFNEFPEDDIDELINERLQ